MRIDKLAMTSREALQNAIGIAADAQAAAVEPIHLLAALLTSGERNISVIIERIGADSAQLANATQQAISRAPKVEGAQQQLGSDLTRVLERAEKKAAKMGDNFVVTEHLLMSLAEDKGEAGRILADAGVTRERIEEVYTELRGDDRVTSADSKTEFEALEQYGRNICDLARAGKLDPVIGRTEEIRRTIQVLSRRTKNNPVLIGEPGVGKTAIVEGIAQRITLSLESGPQGGVPVEGAGFGSAVNAEAIYTVADTLELYDGGMLDLSFLGAAEVDCHGNVNVSKFGSRCTGPGGFVNISQNTKRVFFTGTFTAGGLKEEVRDGRLVILQEGRSKKFRRQVEQITFSGDYAVKSGQDVTFLTERAVLKLTPDGLMLTEIAPGVELEQDILAQMEFRPLISPELREMDHRIFQAGPMGLTL